MINLNKTTCYFLIIAGFLSINTINSMDINKFDSKIYISDDGKSESFLNLDKTWTSGLTIDQTIGMNIDNLRTQFFANKTKLNHKSSVIIFDSYLDENTKYHGPMMCSIFHSISPQARMQPVNKGESALDSTPKVLYKIALNINSDNNQYNENLNTDIISMSNGYEANTPAYLTKFYDEAIEELVRSGKIVVLALGNTQQIIGQDHINNFIERLHSLASRLANDSNVYGRLILVGNIDYTSGSDVLFRESNRPTIISEGGYKYIISAPGTKITACVPKNQEVCFSGTSNATPIVSGIIAQLISEYKDKYIAMGFYDLRYLRMLIAEIVLKNARKTYINTQTMLPLDFGSGVVNYDNAKEGIKSAFDILENKKIAPIAKNIVDKKFEEYTREAAMRYRAALRENERRINKMNALLSEQAGALAIAAMRQFINDELSTYDKKEQYETLKYIRDQSPNKEVNSDAEVAEAVYGVG